MLTLTTAKDWLAVVGALAVLLTPMLRPYVRSVVHGALSDAPALLALGNRISTVEATVARHEDDVRQVPRLVTVLERMETTLDDLNTTLRERVAKLEGATQ